MDVAGSRDIKSEERSMHIYLHQNHQEPSAIGNSLWCSTFMVRSNR